MLCPLKSIILLFFFIMETAYAMDLPLKKSDHSPSRSEKKRKFFKRSPLDHSKKEKIEKPRSKTESDINPGKIIRTRSNSEGRLLLPVVDHSQKTNFYKQLMNCIKNKNHKEIESLIQQAMSKRISLNLNEKNEFGLTPLHYAVLQEDTFTANLLISVPEVDTLMENNDNRTADELMIGNYALKAAIFHKDLLVRKKIDSLIHALIMNNPQLVNAQSHKIIITDYIVPLKKKFHYLFLSDIFTNEFILKMMHHRITTNQKKLENFFADQKKNINTPDEYGNTGLHHAAWISDEEKIKEYIENPFVRSVKNNKQKYPHQVIDSALLDTFSHIRIALFTRQNLEVFSKEETLCSLLTYPITKKLTVTNVFIDETIQNISNRFKEMNKKQEYDRTLPQEVTFPRYATKEKFMLSFLTTILQEEKRDCIVFEFTPSTDSSESNRVVNSKRNSKNR